MNIFESRMNELYALIEHHAGLYYNNDAPEISDSEYDALVRELAELEREYPQYARKDFLTHKVGGTPSELFAKVNHDSPMLSLDNVFKFEPTQLKNKLSQAKQDSLTGFFDGLNQKEGFVCELKIDGLSISLVYEDGVFVQGSTRGNGHTGEDVTENLRMIEAIPKRLKHAPSGLVEVRGEIFMSFDRFNAINERFKERGKETFANTRNAAAGMVRLKDNSLISEYGLDIFLYYLVDAQRFGITKQYYALNWLVERGLPIQDVWKYCENLKYVKQFIQHWEKERHTLSYATDGVVIKLDDLTSWPEIGETPHAPRWAVAYKYPAEKARTKLKDIEITIGRTGVITPVAILDPVLLSGSTIQRATLHNEDYIYKRDIRIGDTVWIYKAGEIIPKVDSVDLSARIIGEKRIMSPFVMPTYCPACGSKIEIIERTIVDGYKTVNIFSHFCTNKACPAQLKGKLQHFVSRKAMDIRGIGRMLAYGLVESGKVKELTDIYILTRDEWIEACNSEKIADKIMKEIEESKSRPLASFITALGIPNVERTLAEKLAGYFKTIEALEAASITSIMKALSPKTERAMLSVHEFFGQDENINTLREELAKYGQPTVKSLAKSLQIIPNVDRPTAQRLARYFRDIDAMTGITLDDLTAALTHDSGMIIVRAIHDFFRDNDNVRLIDSFKALGLNFAGYDRTAAITSSRGKNRPQQPSEILDDRFDGKIFVFTGTLATMTRNEAWAKVTALGGRCSENVSLKTSYVVAGEKAGSKLRRAQELGIEILSEQDFINMTNSL